MEWSGDLRQYFTPPSLLHPLPFEYKDTPQEDAFLSKNNGHRNLITRLW